MGQVDLPAICQLKGVVHVPVLVATVMSYKKKNRRNISKLPNIGFPDLKSQFYFVVVLNKCQAESSFCAAPVQLPLQLERSRGARAARVLGRSFAAGAHVSRSSCVCVCGCGAQAGLTA